MLTDCPSLVAILLEHRLLDPAAESVLPELAATCATPSDLVAEMVRRRWLTHFQAELLLAGRAQELVVGQHILLERLGQGGMGAVYKARHRVLKAVRALKIIHPERLTGPNSVKRFFQEVEAVGKLFHPNIILPHDAGVEGGQYYLAMEYVPGADLGRLLDRGGPLPTADACEYIRQGALALQHAHERGLVHRDIKPANLLVSSADGRVKLLDLGLARVRAVELEGVGPQTALTQAGAMMGTPDYMAPEQAIDSHGVDIRADIYALGCTLYHILAGRPPFAGGSVMEKLIKHRSEEARPIESLCKDLPAALGPVLRKSMAKSAAGRYQTPADFATALAPYCAGARQEKPRPAGTSGEHPVRAVPVTRPSLATPPPDDVELRGPTAPRGRPTITAPPGAMPTPLGRTAHSIETRVDPGDVAQPAVAVDGPTSPPRQRLSPFLALVATVAVAGIAVSIGAREIIKKRQSVAQITVPETNSPPAAPPVTPPAPAPSAVSDPTPPKESPGIAKSVAGAGVDLSRGRNQSGDQSPAVLRADTQERHELLHRLRSGQVIRGVAFSPKVAKAAVLSTRELYVYDLAARSLDSTVQLVDLIPGLSDQVDRSPSSVTFSADGRELFLTASVNSTEERDSKPKGYPFNAVVRWEREQGPAILYGPAAETNGRPEFYCAAAAPGGASVLAAGAPRLASWWNLKFNPAPRETFRHQLGGTVTYASYSPDGKQILFCGEEPDVVIHSLDVPGRAPLRLKGHSRKAMCAAFSSDGRFVASGGYDGKICVWRDPDAPPPPGDALQPTKQLSWHRGEVRAVAFAPAGHHFITGGEDGAVSLGDAESDVRIWREQPTSEGSPILCVGFSSDGAHALYATEHQIGRSNLRPPVLAEARIAGQGPSAMAKSGPTQ
jgi:serine/threonine-protein kinase